MNITTINSYSELEAGITGNQRSFLLLYKEGTDQSQCALNRIKDIKGEDNTAFFAADVTVVRDIHERLNVNSAPSLAVFIQGRMVNIFKGCQTVSAYKSILEGREIGSVTAEGEKKTRQVTVYTTPNCSWCTTLKTYLNENQVQYREVNVAADTAAAESMVRKSGQQGVPQTEINLI